MMHVLCEEYETVYAACLLMTSAVLGVDFGYDVNAQGELEYVVQIEPEMLETLKAGEKITLGHPPDVERIQVFCLRVGNDELSKVVPASYQKPVSDTPKELAPLTGNSAVLSEPPIPELAADSKPFLKDDLLADYGSGGNLTRQPPAAATYGGAGSSTTGSSLSSPIPGADARYGISQNFSVPASTGITRPPSATSPTTSGSGTASEGNSLRPIGSGVSQTSATVPAPPTSSSSSGNGAAASGYGGNGFTGDSANGTTNPGTSGSVSSGRPYPGWGPSTQSGNGAANGQDAGAGSAGGSNLPRYGQAGNAGSNTVNPSDRNNEVSTGSGGTSPGYGGNGTRYNGSSTSGQQGGSTAPQLYNGVGSYSGNGNQTVQPSPPATSSGTGAQDSNWLTGGMTNYPGGVGSNIPNQNPPPYAGPNGQYSPPQQPGYNTQQPASYNNGGYVTNNGVGPYPTQGNNTSPPSYNGQGYPPYVQPTNLTSPEYDRLASLIKHTMQAGQDQASTASLATNTTAKTAEEEPPAAKVPPPDPEIVEKTPEWWQLLALGFLISICANAYMFMTTQDFRRKYQDLLEDVRDLRTLSND